MADYRLILDCYRSGQMSDGDLIDRMQADPLLALWIDHIMTTAKTPRVGDSDAIL